MINNTRLLRVRSDVYEPTLIKNRLIEIAKEHGVNQNVEINLIKNGENYIGKGFVFVDTSFYNILTGKNSDGSEREKEVEGEQANVADWSSGGSVKEALEPIVSKEDFYIEIDDFPVSFNVYPPEIRHDFDTLSSNELLGTYLPNFITSEGISKIFSKYASIKEKNGVVYPKIEFVEKYDNRQVKITFEESTHDAILAHQMQRKTKIANTFVTFKPFFKRTERAPRETRGGRGRGRGGNDRFNFSDNSQAQNSDGFSQQKNNKRKGRRGKNLMF